MKTMLAAWLIAVGLFLGLSAWASAQVSIVPTGFGGAFTAAAGASGVAAGYRIARGTTALDAANPTTIATGLTTVVSCAMTLVRSTALSTGTAFVTHAVASGANVDVYAWLLTGAASTGTEAFEWVCVGT